MSVTFALPPELSADRPPESRGLRRDEVRLLVADDRAVWHARFRDLGRFLNPGDLVVVNTSGTLAAAVHAGAVVLHFSAPLDDVTWVVEVRRPDQSGPVRVRTGSRSWISPTGARTFTSYTRESSASG